MKKIDKKAQIEQLTNLIVPLIGIGIVLVVGFLIMAEAKDQVQAINDSGTDVQIALNGTSDVQNAMSDIPGWLPIIVITVIGAILIGLVSMFRR